MRAKAALRRRVNGKLHLALLCIRWEASSKIPVEEPHLEVTGNPDNSLAHVHEQGIPKDAERPAAVALQ
jgi:hypothetical protein